MRWQRFNRLLAKNLSFRLTTIGSGKTGRSERWCGPIIDSMGSKSIQRTSDGSWERWPCKRRHNRRSDEHPEDACRDLHPWWLIHRCDSALRPSEPHKPWVDQRPYQL